MRQLRGGKAGSAETVLDEAKALRAELHAFSQWNSDMEHTLSSDGNGEHGAVTLIMKTFMAMNFDDVLDLSAEVQSGT